MILILTLGKIYPGSWCITKCLPEGKQLENHRTLPRERCSPDLEEIRAQWSNSNDSDLEIIFLAVVIVFLLRSLNSRRFQVWETAVLKRRLNTESA